VAEAMSARSVKSRHYVRFTRGLAWHTCEAAAALLLGACAPPHLCAAALPQMPHGDPPGPSSSCVLFFS
jgi:hypothetical protein